MDRYMYYCNKCGLLGSAEHEQPTDKQECVNCHTIMKPLLMTSSQWHQLSIDEKEIYKKRLMDEAKATKEFDENLYLNNKYKQDKSENKVAILIRVIAIAIYIVGFIGGIIDANSGFLGAHYFSYRIMLYWWVVTFVSGTMMLGFSEIIRLLDKISKKTNQN